MQPYNPLKKLSTCPLIKQSSQHPAHPKRSHSLRNRNKLSNTKSPQQTITNFRERDLIQDQILKLLQENSKMMGLLTDFDYQIKVKIDQITSIKNTENTGGGYTGGGSGRKYGRQGLVDRVNVNQFREESPILKQLKIIKTKLNSIDVRSSIQQARNSFQNF